MSKNITDIVELGDAITRIQRWRAFIGDNFETKAFFISLDDIRALYEEVLKNEGTGIRGYLARNEADENELLLVGVKDASNNPGSGVVAGKDILMVGGASVIYDLTTPCPNMCDTYSPLFSAKKEKEKLDLSDLSPE